MKTVLITGASRGIGAAVAAAFGKDGYQVAINYCHSADRAIAIQRELEAEQVSTLLVQADITDAQQVSNMVKEVSNHFGFIDVLVNNAGIAKQQLITDTTNDDWQRMMDIHVNGTFYCSKAVLPQMIHRKSGSIVNVSSIWGISGASCEVAYSTAKAAMIGFTKALARELGPSGIRVNAVAPGVIQTEMCDMLTPETLAVLQDEIALCRLGTGADVANAVRFLASDEASFITGQVLTIDGGMI